MVTKRRELLKYCKDSSVLAKIFMVTKHDINTGTYYTRSVLAKIHMVTKPQKYGSTFLNVIEY